MSRKRLNFLGYSAINLPLLMEMAYEAGEFNSFSIFPNIPSDETPVIDSPLDLYNYRFVNFNLQQEELKLGSNFLGVTNTTAKKAVFNFYLNNFNLLKNDYKSICHPTAYISKSAKIDKSVLIEPLAIISAQTTIGFGVTIKRGVNIGHHNNIGNFSSINPGSTISGNVTIKSGCSIGSGAVIKDSITIGENTVIGMGSVVTKNIPSDCIAYGNPCKIVRKM